MRKAFGSVLAFSASLLTSFSVLAQTDIANDTLDQTEEILADETIETGPDGQLIQGRVETGQITIAPVENIVGNRVVLRALDKVTAKTEDFTVKIGDELKYGTLTIKTFHCEIKPPEQIPETFAFLQIFEPARLTKDQKRRGETPEILKRFSGWMLASEPAISALDHPIYDIWVLGCKGGDIN